MRVGFVHGVMNTDNMSIHGLTIDYGPYGWIEDLTQTGLQTQQIYEQGDTDLVIKRKLERGI